MISDEMVFRLLCALFIRLGVKINYIQNNEIVDFSVPSMSDFTAEKDDIFTSEGASIGEPIAGELLLVMASSFFEDNGFKPEGHIRQEYWTKSMGALADIEAKEIIGNEGVCLL